MFGASHKSPVIEFPGVQHYYPSAVNATLVNAETQDDCLQKLERINKEIETVKNEVEKEQRRLSRYRTEQVDGGNVVSKSDATGKNVNGVCCTPSSRTRPTKPHSQARKYVVDNSKPRTDLEYDPLSNFSAGIRSYTSSGKDQKAKSRQGVKRARDAVCSIQNNSIRQAQLAQVSSPEVLDDFKEEGVLIIDIPPSPERKRSRAQKPQETVGIRPQDVVEFKEVKPAPVSDKHSPLLPANPEVFGGKSSPVVFVQANTAHNCGTETTEHLSVSVNQECKSKPVDIFDDLSRCLEDLRRSESLKISNSVGENGHGIELESPTETFESFQDYFQNVGVVEEEVSPLPAELPQSEPPCSLEKMNPTQPNHVPQESTFPPMNPVDVSFPSCHQFTHQAQTIEQPAQHMVQSYWSPMHSGPPNGQKMLSPMQEVASADHTIPSDYLEKSSTTLDSNQCQSWDVPSTSFKSHSTNAAEFPPAPTEGPLVEPGNHEVIVIDSSSEEEDEEEEEEEVELIYSDVDLSDSDPMEECYRIFMEANEGEKEATEQPDVPVENAKVETPKIDVNPQALPGHKRVAHVAKHTEPVAKSRPQPQVLVPLRGPPAAGPAAQLSIPSKIQQMQQRASTLTACMKGGQAFVSSVSRRKPETRAPPPPSPEPATQPIPMQNGYMNCIPVGTAMIQVGNNLHFILPEGSYPLPTASITGPITSVLTPITPVHPSPLTPIHAYPPATAPPVYRHRLAAPVHLPGHASSFSAVSALPHSSLPNSQGAVHVPAKPLPTKRKVKQRPEGVKDKVPHDVRQRYVNMFTEEFLKTSATVKEAFEKALAEERTVYNRSVNKLKYLSVAVNALKRLKNQSSATAKDEIETGVRRSKGSIPLDLKKLKGNGDAALYESLKEYILIEEKLIENNYPLQHPEKAGSAVLFTDNKKGTTDSLKRICCRCGATYSVSQTGKHTRKEECNYHYGKGVENKVPGGVETRYSCCEGVMGAPGCQVFKLHVHDAVSLDGFVSTQRRAVQDEGCPGVYSVDCEMCYTTDGLELSRVTVVNSSLQVVYDTFVRPDNEVIDYNTRFSGICEEDVRGTSTSIREVQETLLSFIGPDTVLIGHGLETDLCALKLFHGTVVDTSVVFPHRLGPPHKLTLNNLTADYLRRIIQDSVCGHDTADDAAACMELMLWKIKEDGKFKRW
ncbi:uncharacterized protein ACJ7VT_008814 [Polymixia lowei]